MNKKGQMDFSNTPSTIMTLGLMALISGALVIALGAMKSSGVVTDQATNVSLINNTLSSGITGIGNFTGQLGTVGTMLGISLVLVVILSVFGFGRGKGGGL